MPRYFITSSGTEIGKTYFLSALVQALKAAGHQPQVLKPVCSGLSLGELAQSDPACLLRALGRPVDEQQIAAICPWQYQAPLTPSMAATLENRQLDLSEVVAFCRDSAACSSLTLVEGVGGVMAPMTETQTVLDWAKALQWSCILVVGTYLGSISHALTALTTLVAAGLAVPFIVVNETENSTVDFESTLETLGHFIGQDRLIPLRRGEGLDSQTQARIIVESVPEIV